MAEVKQAICLLFESVVTNSIYYGGFFIAYLTGIWVPTLTGIALMFGIGNAFDTVVSGLAYVLFRIKDKSLSTIENISAKI